MDYLGYRPAEQVVPIWERRPLPIGRWSTVKFDRLAALDLTADTRTLSRIESSAEASMRCGDYLGALWKYSCAVLVCVQGNQLNLLPAVRAKCVQVALLVRGADELEGLLYAYKQAYCNVKAKPDSDEAYFMIAEAGKRLILLGKGDFIGSTNPLADTINDYCKCFAINPERIGALVEAMVLAADHGLDSSTLPALSSERLLDGTGTKALNYIVEHIENAPTSRLKPAHLRYFLFNVVQSSAAVGGASVKLCALVKKGVAEADILSRMAHLGVKFRVKNLMDLVLSAEEVDHLIEVLHACVGQSCLNSAHLRSAAEAAIKNKKYRFLACLIKHGANPTIGDNIITKLTDVSDPVVLNYVFENGSPLKIAHFLMKMLGVGGSNGTCQRFAGGSDQRCETDGAQEREDELQGGVCGTIMLFKNFVQCGKPLGGKDTVAGIREMVYLVLALYDSATILHTGLLCLLLDCGAKCLDLCQARFQKSTPLHAATALALESGSTDIISALVKCADFTLPEDGKVVDNNGDCPYHLMVKSNREDSIKLKVGIALSGLDPPLDPTVSNATGKDGKGRQAKECAGVSSEVFRCLVTAELKFALAHTTSESPLSGFLTELKEARDIWECIDIMENGKLFREIVQLLEKVGMMEEALKQALKYEQNGTKLGDLSAEYLVHKYARLYSTQKDVTMLETCLAYIPDHTVKAKYWKRCGQYEKAIGIYREMNMHENAFRLMSCLGWYVRGLEMAKQEGDKKWIVNFAVEGAKALLHDHEALDTGTLECLQELLGDGDLSGHNKLLPIIHLLVGSGGGSTEHVLRAAKMFGEQGNVIGELECCVRLLRLLRGGPAAGDHRRGEMLRACFVAQQHADMLSRACQVDPFAPAVQRAFRLALIFYGVRPSGTVYCLHPRQSVWIGGDQKLCQLSEKGSDKSDGMVRLDISKTKQHFLKQLGRLSEDLKGDSGLKRKLRADLCDAYKSQFYKCVRNCLLSNAQAAGAAAVVAPDGLRRYVDAHSHWLEYCCASQQPSDGPVRQLLDLFSPNVFPYLPPGLLHLKLVRSSTQVCECIAMWLQKTLRSMATSEEECKADVWLMLWKASCMVGRGGEELRAFVKNLALKVGDHDVIPAPYLFLDSYTHQFDFWLQACDLICNNGEIIGPAEFVIKYFLSHIAVTAKRGSQIMVMNVVEILSIYSTALLGVIAKSQHRQSGKAPAFVVPSLYQCAIDMFDELNTYGRGGYRLLDACVHQVDIWPEGGLKGLNSKTALLLRQSLDLLLCVLKFSLNNRKLRSPGYSCQYLILALTIVANLVPLSRRDPTSLLLKFVQTIAESNVEGCPRYVADAYAVMSNSEWSCNIFQLIQDLVKTYSPSMPGLLKIMTDGDVIIFSPVAPPPPSPEPCGSQVMDAPVGSDIHIPKPLNGFDESQQCFKDGCDGSEASMQSEDCCQDVGDLSVTNVGYCSACNLRVDLTQMLEHITTTTHHEKEQLLLEYNRMEEECVELQQTLHAAILRLQDGDHHGNRSAKLIHDVEEEVERNGSIFDNIRWRSSWEEGVKELKQMKERVGMLRHQIAEE